jgi:hypothetical protein
MKILKALYTVTSVAAVLVSTSAISAPAISAPALENIQIPPKLSTRP